MKCKCGNEQGKPRVKPYPVTIGGISKGDEVVLLYNVGMRAVDGGYQCWFCCFDKRPAPAL